jgi:hypothetical protein
MTTEEKISIGLIIFVILLAIGLVVKFIGFAVNLLWPIVLVVAIVAFLKWKFGGKKQ